MRTLFTLIAFSLIFLVSCKREEPRYLRKNANTKSATSDLAALNKALKIMRAKDCSDPTSWYYQGAMHWIPDTLKNNKFCESYKNVSDLKEAWDNCTHTPGKKEELHFLIWHRMYIWHFEKIIRRLSGKKDFSLPYWGYDNKEKWNKKLPSIYRDKNSYLYEACRFDSLNMGYAIDGEALRALDLTKLNSYTSYSLFCKNIDAAPHGAMHDYIGSGNDTTGLLIFNNPILNGISHTGLMGWVPTAAFDPIFWLHHSNIDRIWQRWTNSANGKMVTLEDLKDAPWPYVFFDENGKKVEYKIEDVLKVIYDMDYDFDDCKVQPKFNRPRVFISGRNKSVHILKTKITHNTQIIIPKRLKGSQRDNDIIMELEVSFSKLPKGVYEVYVNIPGDTKVSPNSEYFAGFMTFFGKDHKMAGESCKKGCCEPLNKGDRNTAKFEFQLSPKSIQGKSYSIHIYKHNKRVNKEMVVESITFQ